MKSNSRPIIRWLGLVVQLPGALVIGFIRLIMWIVWAWMPVWLYMRLVIKAKQMVYDSIQKEINKNLDDSGGVDEKGD